MDELINSADRLQDLLAQQRECIERIMNILNK
jgi:hypothetical protein